ncbi:MAG: DUF4190 domain-containing protein [Verrucomicrobiales bacterium]|jgi:hypothetical protein|nr:DUF4190 domain-containing protein [Verrucomicrobiales bacterium]
MSDAVAVSPEAPNIKNSRLAIASLVLGIFSPCFCFFFTGIPAVICGHIALGKIKRSAGTLTGSGLAVAGLVLGYVSFFSFFIVTILAGLALPGIHGALNHAKLAVSVRNVHKIVQACRAYADTNDGQFPDSLGVLIEQQLIEEKILNSPLSKQKNETDYVLVTGYTIADGDKVLVYDRNTVRRGKHVYYILGYVNGSAEAVKKVDVDAVLELIDKEDDPTPKR